MKEEEDMIGNVKSKVFVIAMLVALAILFSLSPGRHGGRPSRAFRAASS